MNTFNLKIKAFFKAFTVMAAVLLFTLSSCTKEQKKYDGNAQVAFELSSYSYTLTGNKTITVPVQLIAEGYVAATGTVTTNTKSTCANAVTYNGAYAIDPATFAANIEIAVDYSQLAAGKNTLILDLSSSVKVAAHYKTTTITLTKK